MSLRSVDLNSNINFKENQDSKSGKVTTPIKSEYEKTPISDTFDKQSASQQNKKALPKGLKILLGLGGIGSVCIIAFLLLRTKKMPLEEVQKLLSEIFEKDFSKEEAENLVQKYIEIYKEKGSDTYYQRLVEQLKKDYGIEKVKTVLKIDNTKSEGVYKECGKTARNGDIIIYPENMKELEDKYGFNTLFHELKHLRQYSELWMADSETFLNAVTEDGLKLASKQMQEAKEALIQAGYTEQEANKYIYDELYKRIKKELELVYSDLGTYEKGSPEYNKGISYLDSLIKGKSEAPANREEFEEYKNQLCEREAFKCGENAAKLLKYIQEHSK